MKSNTRMRLARFLAALGLVLCVTASASGLYTVTAVKATATSSMIG